MRRGKGQGLTSRALVVLMIVVAATAGLPFSPLVRTASAAGGSTGSPAVPSVDFAYVTLADDRVRVTATVRGPAGAELRLNLPRSFQDLRVSPGSVQSSFDAGPDGEPAALVCHLGAEKAVVTTEVCPLWRTVGPWSWTPLSAISPSPQGVFRPGGLTAAGRPAAYVVGSPLAGQGFLVRGPGAPLLRWRLAVAGGRVDAYSAGTKPPAGLAEVARLAREYGLFGRDRLILVAAPGDDVDQDAAGTEGIAPGPIDLAAQFWGAALDWDLGEDQEGWLRGTALLSLAATSAEPEAYLEELAADLSVSAARGEALALAINEAMRERTDGRVGFDEVLRYLSAYGAGARLDPFWLRQTVIAAVARNLDDVFDHFYGPGSEAGPATPLPWSALLPTLLADADQDGRPDFIGREAAALLASAAEPEGGATPALPAMAPSFVAAGEVKPGGPATLPPATEDRRVVYLTFDDGPSAVTRQVLQVLRDEGVQATFFVIGNRVHAYADTLRLTVKDGHVIGNHTYDHDMATVYRSPEAFLTSLEQAGQAIFDATGVRPAVTRAPGGSKGHFTREYYALLAENSYAVYDWDVTAADTDPSRPGPEVIAANVLAGVRGRRAPVVLMHDGPGHESTAEALPAIIRGLREEGFEFGTLQPR